jgi:hypothetical protein
LHKPFDYKPLYHFLALLFSVLFAFCVSFCV